LACLTPVLFSALFDQILVNRWLRGEAGELCRIARNAVGTLKSHRDQRKIAADSALWAPSRPISNISASVATYPSGMFRRRLQKIVVTA